MDETETTREQVKSSLPQWKSHKIVRAAPIRLIYKDALRRPADGEVIPGWIIYLEGDFPAFFVTPTVFSRYTPVPGDYFVVYDDGYESVSPKKAFEEGYSQLQVQEA